MFGFSYKNARTLILRHKLMQNISHYFPHPGRRTDRFQNKRCQTTKTKPAVEQQRSIHPFDPDFDWGTI
jgi:hypothetical protein